MTLPGNQDRAIRESLVSFAGEAFEESWRGREREAISHFAFGHLIDHFNGRIPFIHPRQIGIEVCVPGVSALNPKGRVNKDLVIWSSPRSAATWDEGWKAEYAPRAILEWTFSRTGRGWRNAWEYDLNWLKVFTAERRGCTGYAVALVRGRDAFRLLVGRIARSAVNRRWLDLSRPRVV